MAEVVFRGVGADGSISWARGAWVVSAWAGRSDGAFSRLYWLVFTEDC